MTFCLGKTAARDAVKFKYSTYLDAAALPKAPSAFTPLRMLVSNWGMFANDTVSDCVWAGSAHETITFNREIAVDVQFTDKTVLSDYSVVTGYNPANPATDQGTDLQAAASYRRKIGVLDASGKRHKIDSYIALEPGNVDQAVQAAFIFSAVGIGLQLPNSAINQFDGNQPWTPVKGARNLGGHYVPLLGRNSKGYLLVVSWGRLQAMSPEFLAAYMDEGLVYLSFEYIKNKLSPQGFDEVTLRADLTAISGESTQKQGVQTMAANPTSGGTVPQSGPPAPSAQVQRQLTATEYAAVLSLIESKVAQYPGASIIISEDDREQFAADIVNAVDQVRAGATL